MKKLILTTTLSFATSLFALAQNLTPAKAVSFIKQPYSKVKVALSKEGYSFLKKDGEFFVFKKGKYELTIALKQNAISVLSVQESLNDFSLLTSSLEKSGFILTKSSNGTSQISPMSILRYDKEHLYMCSIVAAMNMQATGVISLNYGVYSK